MSQYEQTRLDDFYDKHPRIDKLMIRYAALRRRPKQIWRNRQARRKWYPGVLYLDHGTEPCILLRLYDEDEMLEGISLVDGRTVSGCSIYACGPVLIHTAEEVMAAARAMEEAKA